MGYKAKRIESGCCLECGKAFYGRTDKKFCGEECKNRFHNSRSRYFSSQRKKICNSLMTNYYILLCILGEGRSSASIEELTALGYRDGLATGQAQCGPHTVYACFDILFSRSKTRIFQIRKGFLP